MSVTLSAIGCRFSAQSSAESPPPRITTFFAGILLRIANAIGQLAVVFELGQALDLRFAWLEGANASGDEHCLGNEFGAGRGFEIKRPSSRLATLLTSLAQMERRLERLGLFHEAVGQLLAGADRHRRDVVNRFVGIKLDGLAADLGQLESITWALISSRPSSNTWNRAPARAGANDDGIGFDRAASGNQQPGEGERD